MPPFSFCRWNSAAIRLLLFYISQDEPTHDLVVLVTFVQQVYIPMWLRIRIQSSWENGSRHLFCFLEFARKAARMCHDNRLVHVTEKVIVDNGYFAHSENVLLTMLTDSDPEIRQLAYTRILEIRAKRHSDGVPFDGRRTYSKPQPQDFNFHAESYYSILKPENFVDEPPFTQRLDQKSFEDLAEANKQVSVPPIKLHSQDTERLVAVMNKCVGRISGLENQNAIMEHKLRSLHRNARNVKKDYQTFEATKEMRWRRTDNNPINRNSRYPKRKKDSMTVAQP